MVHRYFSIILFLSFTASCFPHPVTRLPARQDKPEFKTSTASGFIENKGQIIDQNNKPNTAVLFLLNTPGFNVQLRKNGFSYDLYRVSNQIEGNRQQAIGNSSSRVTRPMSQPSDSSTSINYHRIDFDLVGSNRTYPVIASGTSTDYMNYYSGGTLPEGMTSVHSYKEVVYSNLYPGIDLQFTSSDDLPFKYNFILHPGANIEDIRIKISGSEKIKVSNDMLVCKTPIEQVNEIIPECYYMSVETRIPVHARFYRINEHLYGVKTDHEWPGDAVLFIDPLPARRWGTYYGVSWSSEGSCSIDQAGDVYIAGTTTDPSNIATSGAFQSTISSYQDAFLAKFNPSGERLWGTYFGGTGSDDGLSCAVDHEGNIYLMGVTGSPGLATPGAYQTVVHGAEDGFIAKFNPSGQRIWATYYGGYDLFTDLNEEITYCTFDSLNNVYCSGLTSSPTDIATPGAHQTTIGGNYDAFLVKFTSSGIRIWATYYGGANREDNPFCTATRNGFILLSGSTTSTNNIATPGSFMSNYSGSSKSFLACFDTNGVRQWGTYFGGLTVSLDLSYGCSSDSSNNIYLYGTTTSLNNIGTAGTYQPAALVGGGYLEQFSTSGSRLWGTYYGQGEVMAATTSDSGYIYICGQTGYGVQDPYIASPYAYQTLEAGNVDTYLAKFNASGQRIWGTYYGGQVWDEGLGCAKDHSDNVYLFGFTTSPNNSSDTGPCLRSSKNNIIASQNGLYPDYFPPESVFLVKFSECYFPDTALQIYGPSSLCANSTGIVFSIDPLITAESYHWCVTGDLTITAGQGTTSIILNVGPIMGIDTISVYGINACDTGFPKVITCRVYQRPNPQISGIDTTCTGSVNLFTTSGGKTNYQWTFSPGGILIAGGTTTDSSCSISWSSGGAQWVRLNYTDTTDCNALAPSQFDIWVIQGPPVSVSISSSSNPVCIGTSVTYTAIGVNEGSSPVYHWKVNGIDAGTNSTTFMHIPNNGDIITCLLTSNIACGSGNPATSNTITIIVEPYVAVDVSITDSQNPICTGTSVTFTATSTNGGTTPSYQWKVNGIDAGTDNPIYSYSPNNGDIVTCVLTSNVLCPTGNPSTSNIITMIVNPNHPVSVSISTPNNPYCQGSTVTFTAATMYGGPTPSFQWLVNGIGVGTNNPVYSYIPANGELVTCVMNSNIACPTGNPATSNTITMVENTVNPVSIIITTPVTTVCSGTSVIFTATPTNGGTTPNYQWKVNGVNSGSNNSQFTYTPVNGDCINCILTSNLVCASGNPATSNSICMTVNPNLPVSVGIAANPPGAVCAGTTVVFMATGTHPGNNPVYTWKVNNVNVGGNSTTYSYVPASGDQVICILNSDATCATGNPATSNLITEVISANMPVGILISASNNPVCSGISVTYTATPTNGGTTPVYLWKVNGINAGTNNTTYQYVPVNGDLITCMLTSNLTCTSGNPATSNTITMGVAASPVVTLTRCNDSVITTVAQPFRLKGGIPLGGNYSGPGVTNGIFYPAIAGVGSKTITYSYTNAALCSATANLTIIVNNPAAFACGNNLTDIRDNKFYPTVQIGGQCWMATNLNYGTMIPGAISQRDNCTPEKYCFNDLTADCGLQTYYQWDELMAYDETLSTQGLCPPGWHVPSEADWNILFGNYISNAFAAWPLLFTGYSGFNATLSATRHQNKTWDWNGFATMFWSSTTHGSEKAWSHGLNDTDPSISLYPSLRSNAFSVRCVHD